MSVGGAPVRVRRAWLPYDERAAAGLLLPLGLVLMAVTVVPIAYSFWTSLFALNLRRPLRVPFVGLANYLSALGNDLFLAAVGRTVQFTLMSVTAVAVLGLLAALLSKRIAAVQPVAL